jgi:acetyl esterase/lipase
MEHMDDTFAKDIVHRVGCTVVSVNCRLAPEAPFPAALEDCYAALRRAIGFESAKAASAGAGFNG